MSVSGHFVYKNLAISQHPDIFTFFKNLITTIKPARILEIGTSHGGLSLMIRDILDDNNLKETHMMTYDIYEQTFLKPLVVDRNTEVKTETLFCDHYKMFKDEETKNAISYYIRQSGTSLVLCDGGNKQSEFNLFSELIKQGDVIMAHDYAPNKEYFEQEMKNKIWNWHEIQDSDIIESCQSNGLKPYMREEFLNVAWACFKKE